MPFPTVGAVRKAVETQLHEGLEAIPSEWVGTLDDGQEVHFSPGADGVVEVELDLDDEECARLANQNLPFEPVKTYKFKIVVQVFEG